MDRAERILSIEDDQAIREAIAIYLEDSGYEVLQAGDGRSGLELFEQETPDLVLCDLRMPTMDGLEVLEQLTKQSPETPVLIVSGMGDVGDAIQALKLGAWDYVTKPIHDMAVLEHAIDKALERAKLQRINRLYREHLERINEQLSQSLQQFHEDEAAGRHIQFQLLPENKEKIGGYIFERALYTSTLLSGDFVDYFTIDEQQLGFYMADVSGHGISSALVTLLLKNQMRRFVELYRSGQDDAIIHPARTLERLNLYLQKAQLKKYLTIFYGVLTHRENSLRYANGGQFPFPLLKHDGEINFMGEKSLPVGLFDYAEYQEVELALPPAFVMTFVSDGILDLLPGSNLEDKLNHLLNRVKQVDSSVASLAEALTLREDDPRPDDITLLVVRREQ
ncbi:MAG: SpoIIE family protein phosphatase [Chromatiales bacterium]|nr:SpoIIE family protein phosphatase [Chromatiales bacterium]